MQTLVIGVGEFGINVACQFFTHLIIEHNLLNTLKYDECSQNQKETYDYSTFFTENSKQQPMRANLLIFDTEYDTYQSILKNYPLLVPFIGPQQVIALYQLTGGSYHKLLQQIRGKSNIKEQIKDILRKEMERKAYNSILMLHSIAGICWTKVQYIYIQKTKTKKGGTGSGLASCILAEVCIQRNRHCATVNLILLPSEYLSTNSLEWYNAAAALETISESCELTIMVDNQALSYLYKKSVMGNQVDDLNINYHDLNVLIVQVIAQLTSSQRFKSQVQKKFQDIIINTVLYRSIHFLVPTLFDTKSITMNHPQIHKQQMQLQSKDKGWFHMFQSNPIDDKVQVYQLNLLPADQKKYQKFRFSQPQTYNINKLQTYLNYSQPTSIFVQLLDRQNCLATCDDVHETNAKQFYHPKDKFVSAFTAFNSPHSELQVIQALMQSKDILIKTTQTDFMSMSPCPFSFSLTSQPAFSHKRDLNTYYSQNIEIGATMLQNKFTIHNIFEKIHKQVSNIFYRKLFLQYIDPSEIQVQQIYIKFYKKQIDIVKCLERDYGDWIQAEEIVHLFEESLDDDEIQSQSESSSDCS